MPRVAVDPASTLQFHVSSGGVLCLAARAKRASNRNASGRGFGTWPGLENYILQRCVGMKTIEIKVILTTLRPWLPSGSFSKQICRNLRGMGTQGPETP